MTTKIQVVLSFVPISKIHLIQSLIEEDKVNEEDLCYRLEECLNEEDILEVIGDFGDDTSNSLHDFLNDRNLYDDFDDFYNEVKDMDIYVYDSYVEELRSNYDKDEE